MGVKHQKKYSCMKGFNDLKKKLASLFGKWSRSDLEALPCERRDPAKTPLLVVLVAAHGQGPGQVQGVGCEWAERRPWGEYGIAEVGRSKSKSVNVRWRAMSTEPSTEETASSPGTLFLYAKVAIVRAAVFPIKFQHKRGGADDGMFVERSLGLYGCQ